MKSRGDSKSEFPEGSPTNVDGSLNAASDGHGELEHNQVTLNFLRLTDAR
jgi:hypothetical protein